jgi:hypothetical protein
MNGATLDGADLRGADFRGAVLSRARFGSANVEGARFEQADLSGADMANVEGFVVTQVDAACGDALTRLPGAIQIRLCADVQVDAQVDALVGAPGYDLEYRSSTPLSLEEADRLNRMRLNERRSPDADPDQPVAQQSGDGAAPRVVGFQPD